MNDAISFDPLTQRRLCRIQRVRRMLDKLASTEDQTHKIDLIQHLHELRQKHDNVHECVMFDVMLGRPLSEFYKFFDYEGMDSIEYSIEFHYFLHFDTEESLTPTGDCEHCQSGGSMNCEYV